MGVLAVRLAARQMMLFGLLLWQNPVLAVEDWLVLTPIRFSFEDSGVWHWVRLGRDLCQFTGMQVHKVYSPGFHEGEWCRAHGIETSKDLSSSL